MLADDDNVQDGYPACEDVRGSATQQRIKQKKTCTTLMWDDRMATERLTHTHLIRYVLCIPVSGTQTHKPKDGKREIGIQRILQSVVCKVYDTQCIPCPLHIYMVCHTLY